MFVSSRINAKTFSISAAIGAYSFDATFFPLPATLWVRPTAGNTFTVDYSTDNGANYQSLTALTGSTTYSETVVTSGFTNLKITTSGTQGGTWGVC